MNRYPKSRDTQIVIQESGNEILIYDLTCHQASCLNETSAQVWLNCDGKTPIFQIAKKIKIPEEIVFLAVTELQKANLLEEPGGFEFTTDRLSRRKLLLKVGATSAALPLITSLIAPTAVNAQSGCIGTGGSFDLTSSPFFADAVACVNALVATAAGSCCSGTLNPAGGFQFSGSPPLCRGFCG